MSLKSEAGSNEDADPGSPLPRHVSLGKSLHTLELVSSIVKWDKAPNSVVGRSKQHYESQVSYSLFKERQEAGLE